MTRKRVQEDLVSSISQTCPYCLGTGTIRDTQTVVYDVIREIKRIATRNKRAQSIFVNSNPQVADMLYSLELKTIELKEKEFGQRVVVRALGHYHIQQFEVYAR